MSVLLVYYSIIPDRLSLKATLSAACTGVLLIALNLIVIASCIAQVTMTGLESSLSHASISGMYFR